MIKLQQLSKTYQQQQQSIHAIRDINLNVDQGRIFGIIGKSGAGKSTLLRCVNLLEKPTSGDIYIDQQQLNVISAARLKRERQKISMIFQHFNLLESRTVYQNIALPLEICRQSKSTILKTVFSLLELVGLSDKANTYPCQLSGGQKQRVAIARALACQPKVLLCDEATSALDPDATNNILQLLKSINQQFNLTILLITHEMNVIKNLCHEVGVLDQGKLVEQGCVNSVFKAPKAAATKQLLQHEEHARG